MPDSTKYYLNQFGLIISDVLWLSSEGNFTGNAQCPSQSHRIYWISLMAFTQLFPWHTLNLCQSIVSISFMAYTHSWHIISLIAHTKSASWDILIMPDGTYSIYLMAYPSLSHGTYLICLMVHSIYLMTQAHIQSVPWHMPNLSHNTHSICLMACYRRINVCCTSLELMWLFTRTFIQSVSWHLVQQSHGIYPIFPMAYIQYHTLMPHNQSRGT